MTSDNISIYSTRFRVDKDGNMLCNNATMYNASIIGGSMQVSSNSSTDIIKLTDNSDPNRSVSLGTNEAKFTNIDGISYISINNNYNGTPTIWIESGSNIVDISDDGISISDNNESTTIFSNVIYTPRLVQTSLESQKKNFEKYQNALETLNDIEIYKYNLKSEENGTKKHIGFVIGDDFKYSQEVTSKNNDGVDIYSFVSLCCQSIKEQQAEIEDLKEEIKLLKGDN